MSRFHPFLLAAAIALGTIGPALASAPSIVIDGSTVPADVPALVSDGRVFVPLRGVFERLGARVSYDAASQTALASLDGKVVQVTVGSTVAHVDGRRYDMDVAAREFAGRVMIPLRFVAQALGANVDYDGPSNTVVIVSGMRPGSFAAMTSGPNEISAARTGHAPSIEDQHPSSGTVVGSEYPSIYARFDGGSSAVDPASVRVMVDGADVTGSSTISSAYVSYTPSSPLLTGLHSVTITGNADDGTTFTSGWSFRIDAGTVSDYTSTSFTGGDLGYNYGYGQYGYGGWGGFGWPVHGFGPFGFSPPGFSLFTPGSLFFVSGGVIGVVFVSQFFPSGNGVFTISGFPGTFPLTPWLGNPGMFWGTAQVPFGVTAHQAIIAARFQTPGGRKFIVHSMAPLEILGTRKSLPPSLHYAVLPRLVNHPTSLHNAVVFERMIPEHVTMLHAVRSIQPQHIGWENAPSSPAVAHAPIMVRGEPGVHGQPVAIHPVAAPGMPVAHPIVHPVIHPVIHPPQTMPVVAPGMQRFPMMQWQFQAPSHPAIPVTGTQK